MFINILPYTILTRGVENAAIFNMEEGSYTRISLSWYNVIMEELCNEINIDEIRPEVGIVLDFLLKNKLAILSETKLDFVPVSKKWDIPFEFHTLIIDAENIISMMDIIKAMPHKRISMFTQIRLFWKPNIKCIEEILGHFIDSGIFNIEIITNMHEMVNEKKYESLLYKYPYHLSKIVIMGAYNKTKNDRFILNEEYMSDDSICGNFGEDLLSINIESYKKYYQGNSCLWKKISIDKAGNIKNCPSMKFSYGSIFDMDILSVIGNKKYKWFSELKKEHIEVCKGCELKLFCIDCRAFTINHRLRGKPLKCSVY